MVTDPEILTIHALVRILGTLPDCTSPVPSWETGSRWVSREATCYDCGRAILVPTWRRCDRCRSLRAMEGGDARTWGWMCQRGFGRRGR